jgi:hypothetical protein
MVLGEVLGNLCGSPRSAWRTPALMLPKMLYLAEFYLPGEASLAELADRARAGAEQSTRDGCCVGFIQVIFVPQDENCFVVYCAGTSADVASAGGLAGLEFDRVVPAVLAP